ncbi:hypothetical protein EK21DRAFT_71606 [Setomelanomma holmii]|uniref:Uncharacterized protein n=1 Tax=Setomelanomma holmii TaxID=210430 RepID=A0A9P4LJH3_9PLEO|nr:hypothetical protein EK21DRAFT_71606 [Setomelanomma holmii]
MANKPLIKKLNATYKKRLVCGSLALACLLLASTIFALSTRAFLTWYHNTHPLHRANDLTIHTPLYIASCAPLCTYLGILGGVLYYRRKRNKYGKYEATMRRQGRGYWIDPSDAEDKKKVDAAKKLNTEPRVPGPRLVPVGKVERMSIFGPLGWGGRIGGEQGSTSVREEGRGGMSVLKRLTNLHPLGWGDNNEYRPRTAEPERTLSRADSIRSCKDDPVVERAAQDIWLSAVRGSGSSWGSRHAR